MIKIAYFLKFIILSVFLVSCLPEQPPITPIPESGTTTTGGGTSNTGSTNTSTDSILNYLQSGSTSSTSTLAVQETGPSFYIRGSQVSQYLNTASSSTSFCVFLPFTNSINNDGLLVRAQKKYFIKYFPSISFEYYFIIYLNEDSSNDIACNNTDLHTKIAQTNTVSSFAYSLESVCPDCTSNFTSNSIKLYTQEGTFLSNIDLTHLRLQVKKTSTSTSGNGSVNNGAVSCVATAECKAQGYNCCLQNQCVNDGAIKPGIDKESPEFIASINDDFRNHSEFYYICPNAVSSTPNDSDPIKDNLGESNALLTSLKEYNDCIKQDKDEQSICTITYAKASDVIDLSDPSSPEGAIFEAAIDDLNFSSVTGNDDVENIVEVIYGGTTLYREGDVLDENSKVEFVEDTRNDSLDSAQAVKITATLPGGAIDDSVRIKYKIDGSCEKITSTLGRCTKTYYQGQMSDPARPSDHEEDNNIFKLPSYATMEFNVIVKLNGSTLPQGQNTWAISEDEENAVEFIQPVYPNQEVKITFFVGEDYVNLLTTSKDFAQTKINTFCNCGTSKCSLKAIADATTGKETSYNCVYPENVIIEVPLQQSVIVSSKSVPHRFFDEFGISYDTEPGKTGDQEGLAFGYYNSDQLKPYNLTEHIGFNEILGSLDKTTQGARPAKLVNVKKGRFYDLYVDYGAFSSCIHCGSDYYSALQKIFPSNFIYNGGGYKPDLVETRRFENQGTYRADDLLFGRACFVPPTMIPNSHTAKDSVQEQRLSRLSAQHFLFANGYNRDWFGFDYGSLIGSFDGVKWFSIGNKRSIKADTNRLYIATNTYFGDLVSENSFKVVVSENTTGGAIIDPINNDLDTDGAECQKSHLCSSDNDCINQLGYDYSCQSVSALTTSWPMFDSNANEIPAQGSKRTYSNLVGGLQGFNKRCIYRGRGAACSPNPYEPEGNYNSSSAYGPNSCSPNNHCESIAEGSKFNTKIARMAKSATLQNSSSYITEKVESLSPIFGLGTRVIGRPFDFFGTSEAPEGVPDIFSELEVAGICVPGKSPETSSLSEANATAPDENIADTVLGIGVTATSQDSPSYLSLCPTTNEDGNLLSNLSDLEIDNEDLVRLSISQNLSSNLLRHEDFESISIFTDDEGTTKGLKRNSCLRAPGSSCFTDLDCAPNKFISDRVKQVLNFNLNIAEQNFWKEELVCGQNKNKYIPLSTEPNSDYKITDNKCCREIGKEITIYSATSEEPIYNTETIAGYSDDNNILSSERYSRLHSVWDKINDPNESEKYPKLISPTPDGDPVDLNSLLRQYNTFHTAASRTCCGGNWVRNFHSSNVKGKNSHHWVEGHWQNIPVDTFKCFTWLKDNGINNTGDNGQFECTPGNYQSQECEIINLSPSQEEFYLNWFGKFELIGIPQIAIENENYMKCNVSYTSQSTASSAPPKATIKSGKSPEVEDDQNISYLSAGDITNFDSGSGKIKQIFDDNKVSCCLPTGQFVPDGTTDEQCCTGKVFSNKCCLEDYTDISVYLNRYVSSEAADLSDNQIDPATGYIKDPGTVKQLALAKNMCCSGKATFGWAIHNLLTPGAESEKESKYRRFINTFGLTDNNSETGNIGEIYKHGVRWNNHVYCVPKAFKEPKLD